MSELTQKAKEIFTYAFPLIVTEATHWGSDDKGFKHRRKFPDHNDKQVVKMNNDTLYSMAWTQLANTPYIIHIPEITERYYLFPILDAYTNVFESIGTRTPRRSAGDYIFLYGNEPVPAGYENYTVIRSEYSLNAILLRVETRGKKDYGTANKIQDSITIKPLYEERIEPVPESNGIIPAEYAVSVSAEEFFTLFAKLARVNPIKDKEILNAFELFGFVPETGEFSYSALTDEQRYALEEGRKAALEDITSGRRPSAKTVLANNWRTIVGGIGVYGDDYLSRASVAYSGWGANIAEDSVYSVALTDIDGDALDNKHSYKLHFNADGFPHAAVFWSLTLYGEPSMYLVPNSIDRFAINTYDVNDSIVSKNGDGSLDIYISSHEPDDEKQKNNWLPSPENEENFSLAIRIYWPDEFTLQGKWNPPIISKIK